MTENTQVIQDKFGKISVETTLGTLHAEVVSAKGEYPGISVTLEKGDGSTGFVSLTEVCDADRGEDGRARLQTNCYDGKHEEPTAIACDPDGPWMSEFPPEPARATARDDAAWHESLVVLETDGDDALLFNPSSTASPFIIAPHFDPESKSWSGGSYFSDLLSATCCFNGVKVPDRDSIEADAPSLDGMAFDSGLDELAAGKVSEAQMLDSAATCDAPLATNGSHDAH